MNNITFGYFPRSMDEALDFYHREIQPDESKETILHIGTAAYGRCSLLSHVGRFPGSACVLSNVAWTETLLKAFCFFEQDRSIK